MAAASPSGRPAPTGRPSRAPEPDRTVRVPTSSAPTAPAPDQLTVLVVVAALVLSPIRLGLVAGITPGLLVGIVLAPVWLPHLKRYRGGWPFALLTLVCLVSGLWLTAVGANDHQSDQGALRQWVVMMVLLAVNVGIILWARSVLRDAAVVTWYGVGMLASAAVTGVNPANFWKGTLSLALTVLLLGLAWLVRRRGLELVLCLTLAGISALQDSRSHFAMVLLAACLVLWQVWVRGRARGTSAWRSIVLLAGLGVAIYSFGQALMLEGYLGEETQQRTLAQTEGTGSILLGGRPELGATVALMRERPWGFGFGTLPNAHEIAVAKAGMATLDYDPDNGYVDNYMFGQLVKLHSVIGDSWSMFGIPGLVLAGFFLWAVLHRVAADLPTSALSAVVAFLAIRVVWDSAFGPLYSSLAIFAIAVGISLVRVTSPPGEVDGPPERRGVGVA